MMSGMWEGGCEKKKMMMVEERDLSNHEETRMMNVAALALGLRPRQRGCKGAGQEKARESHHILPGV